MKWDMEFEINNFNIKYTLDSGQCFRWKCLFEDEENKVYEYIGVIEDRVIKIRQEQNKFYIASNKKENLKEVVYDYFDLNKDYTVLEEKIRKIDSNVDKAVEFSTGMHMLNQPVFETIISYIISAKGGIAVAIQSELNVPVKYIGVGETIEDLQKFDVDEFVNALFDIKPEEEEQV